MGSCGALSSGDVASAAWWRCGEALPGGDAAECCPVEMLRSTAQLRCCESLPGGDAAKRCLVEMLQALPCGDAAQRCLPCWMRVQLPR